MFPTLAPKDREHVFMLADKIGARITEGGTKGEPSSTNMDTREIEMAPGLKPSEWYWVALHELGHLATEQIAQPRDYFLANVAGVVSPAIVEDEVSAWNWALGNSYRKPSKEDYQDISWRIESYARMIPRISKATRDLLIRIDNGKDE